MRIDLPTPASVLAVAAHPDDVEFECGATLAKWAEAGATVHVLICTDGSKGTWDVNADTNCAHSPSSNRTARSRPPPRRHRRSALPMGAEDGELDHTVERRSHLSRIIRELQPEVVLGHDPWQRWRIHPDHRAAGWLTVDAVVAARDPHYHREHGVAHHRPAALLLFECEEPNHLEAVEQSHLDAKVSALLAHESQFETTMEIDADDDGTQAQEFRQRILREARDHGRRGGVRYAEAFRLIDPAS